MHLRPACRKESSAAERFALLSELSFLAQVWSVLRKVGDWRERQRDATIAYRDSWERGVTVSAFVRPEFVEDLEIAKKILLEAGSLEIYVFGSASDLSATRPARDLDIAVRGL